MWLLKYYSTFLCGIEVVKVLMSVEVVWVWVQSSDIRMWCSLPLYRDDVVCTTLALPEVSQTCFNHPKWCRSLPSNVYNLTTVFAWLFNGIAEPLDDIATAKWQRPAWEDGWRSIFSSISKGCRCSVSRERYRVRAPRSSQKDTKRTTWPMIS